MMILFIRIETGNLLRKEMAKTGGKSRMEKKKRKGKPIYLE